MLNIKNTWHRYFIYDLIFQSQLPLIHLKKWSAGDTEDAHETIIIEWGKIAQEGLENPMHQGFCFQAKPNEYCLTIPSIARFFIRNGNHIIIEPNANIDEESIGAILIQVVFEILLKQRQLLVTRGIALKMGNETVAFIGKQTTGFFMLIAALLKRGHCFLGGPFFAINSQGNILAGIAQIVLFANTAHRLGFAMDTLQRLRPNVDQFIIPIETKDNITHQPLHTIYAIKPSPHSEILFSKLDKERKNNALRHLFNEVDDPNSQLLQLTSQIELIEACPPITGIKLLDVVKAIEMNLFKSEATHGI